MSKSWLLFFSVMAILSWNTVALAQTEPLEVVASFSILADVVAQVAGEHATVSSVMPVDANPHAFEPTPSSLTALASADVVFTNGLNLEEGLLPVIANATTASMIEVSRCVFVRQFGVEADEHEEHHEEEAHEHETHDESCEQIHAELANGVTVLLPTEEDAMMAYMCEVDEAEHEGEEHTHAGCDPHVWQNPYNVMVWTLAVRDALTELDPAHADAYASNAQTYLTELNMLVTDFILPTLATLPVEQRLLVTNHETMGYLAQAFEFRIVATVMAGRTTGADGSLQDLTELVDLLNEQGVTAIFSETTVNNEVIEQLANEVNVPMGYLYTDSLSDSDGVAPTYLEFMRYNIGTLVETLTPTMP